MWIFDFGCWNVKEILHAQRCSKSKFFRLEVQSISPKILESIAYLVAWIDQSSKPIRDGAINVGFKYHLFVDSTYNKQRSHMYYISNFNDIYNTVNMIVKYFHDSYCSFIFFTAIITYFNANCWIHYIWQNKIRDKDGIHYLIRRIYQYIIL